MKGERKLIGKKIVKVFGAHDYVIATLDDGSEIEIGGIYLAKEVQGIERAFDMIDKSKKKNN